MGQQGITSILHKLHQVTDITIVHYVLIKTPYPTILVVVSYAGTSLANLTLATLQ